jgi:hypothetical protein
MSKLKHIIKEIAFYTLCIVLFTGSLIALSFIYTVAIYE